MRFKAKVYGKIELDGTHKCYVSLKNLMLTPDSYLKLKNSESGKVCGCIIGKVDYGSENILYLDRLKQDFLKIRDGEIIEVESNVNFNYAQNVSISVLSEFPDKYKDQLTGKPVVKGEKTAIYTFTGKPKLLTIRETKPEEIVIIGVSTNISIIISGKKQIEETPVKWSSIGGLKKEIKVIREILEFPLRYPEAFRYLGVPQPKGILLYGPPGTGKTLIAKALANEIGAAFYTISGPEIYSKWYGQTERNLREIFEKAQKNVPSVILIDEIDALAPNREKVFGDLERRVVTTLLTLMDGLKEMRGIVVVGTTNRINSIDPALRREGRFGREIYIGVPDFEGRKEILKIHTAKMPIDDDVDFDRICSSTVGFVGADIVRLCCEAAYSSLRRNFASEILEKGEIFDYENTTIKQIDFENALKNVQPSAMREFLIEIPKVSWKDIGGLEDVKKILIENISYSITKREVFEKLKLKPAKGILLYGPPGTGKTLIAKAVANECGANFISIKGPELRSKWFGETEEKIRFIFSKAREVTPCVIFIDEIDAAVPARGKDASGLTDSTVNQILAEMDGIESSEGVFVIGATNRPELLDKALLRPGRMDFQIEIPLPDKNARKAIFKIHLKGKPLSSDVDLDKLAKITEGFSGAEIAESCREASWEAIREGNWRVDKILITMEQIVKSLRKIKQTQKKLEKRQVGFLREENEEV